MPQASRKLPLHGWYVISMRPLGQHGGVRSCAATMGARAFSISSLRLRPLPAGENLARALQCARVVVTSPAAARFAHAQQDLRSRPGQRWFALGAGTAGVLSRLAAAPVEFPPIGSDSEALLALPGLQAVDGDDVGLLTAPGGRGLVAGELRARGARLHVAEVYRRESIVVRPSRLRQLAALPAQSALLLTSEEAFAPLWSELDESSRALWRERPCVVASVRLQALARSLGFSVLPRAVNARPPALLAALQEHVGQLRFR